MAYIVIRGSERLSVGPNPLLLKNGDFELTFWQGNHEQLGPTGYQVADNTLTVQRSAHPVDLGLDPGVANIYSVGPDFLNRPWKINFSGEPLLVLWEEIAQTPVIANS